MGDPAGRERLPVNAGNGSSAVAGSIGSFSIRASHPHELPILISIDDEAGELYQRAGLAISLDRSHPFVAGESARWTRAIALGLALTAVDSNDHPIGFATFGLVDGEPYLDQVSVRPGMMRRGVGTALLNRVVAWSSSRPLWLTTYSHLPWNRPWYERHGFAVVPETSGGPEMQRILQEQRTALPYPDMRVVMVRQPSPQQSLSSLIPHPSGSE